MAVDATLVSAVKADGQAHPQAHRKDGVRLAEAHKRKARSCEYVRGVNRSTWSVLRRASPSCSQEGASRRGKFCEKSSSSHALQEAAVAPSRCSLSSLLLPGAPLLRQSCPLVSPTWLPSCPLELAATCCAPPLAFWSCAPCMRFVDLFVVLSLVIARFVEDAASARAPTVTCVLCDVRPL